MNRNEAIDAAIEKLQALKSGPDWLLNDLRQVNVVLREDGSLAKAIRGNVEFDPGWSVSLTTHEQIRAD